MDAREALRRYLEQRRDLGDREFVLDDLPVDDVLRIVGALPASGVPTRHVEEQPRAIPSARDAREAALPETGDWREMLRAADGADARTPPAAAPMPGNTDEPDQRVEAADVAMKRARKAADASREPTPKRSTRGGRAAPTESGPASTDEAPAGIVVGASGAGLFAGPMEQLRSLEEIAKTVAVCERCRLYKTAINPVPGEGNPDADLVCVGEAPGANEDESGRPFVGQAGQLLTKILAAIDLQREDVFICNVLKHRPPGNRNPAPDEVKACSPYLVRQLELIQPKVIVAFGTFAAQTLLDTKLAIGKLRGSVHRYYGIPLVVTYHPAALLRNPAWKRPTWEDVQLARRILDRARGA
jgi:uracil-DNA glycosylase family 4